MKVICAGAPKTGTKSMARALRILGYDAVFDIEEAMEFAFEEWESFWTGKTPDMKHMLDNVYSQGVEAVVDMPHSCFFEEFLKKWPKAKVILMLRDIDEWFYSYKNMVERAQKNYAILHIFYYFSPAAKRLINWCYLMSKNTIGTVGPEEILWKSWYKKHNCYVRNIVPTGQLLEYSVEEGWEPLCKFLGKEVPDQPFPFENQANLPHNITDKMMQDTWIAKKMACEIKAIVVAVIVLVIVMTLVLVAIFDGFH